ncbi:hypothetical protein BJY01DRAFT_221820 [Aspergillus pseudoustus]|uniref:F-box domain-containing protein n=1 Tax=Aspergillus pseudoustus TaxID=1810923 RepID=A0ABR4J977_9EURO
MPLDISARSYWTSAHIHAAKPRRRTPAKSQRNPFGSKASCPRLVSSTPLINLPSELLLAIFSHLGNLDDLFSIIFTCKRFFDVFQTAQQSLIQSTFTGYTCLKSDRVIYKGLLQLIQVIERDIVPRDVAKSIFELAWKLFRQDQLEVLLIPLGKALAWSFVLDDRDSEAISILRLIEGGLHPYECSRKRTSQLPIQPIQHLLEQLLSAQEKDYKPNEYVGFAFDDLLEIHSRSKQNATITLNNAERIILLKDGILFRDQSIVVRHSRPQLPKANPTYSNYWLRRSGPSGNETTSISAILAHRVPSEHPLLRRGDVRLASEDEVQFE